MKQFAVIGLNTFGRTLAHMLFEMGQEVLAVDNDPELVDDIRDEVTQAVRAELDDEDVIKALGLNNFDAVIVAIGKDIQTSILVSLLCKQMGVRYLVARARNDLHAKVLEKIGVDKVIFPERDTGVRLAHSLVSSNILDVIELSEEYNLVEVAVPHAWAGKTLRSLNMRADYGLSVIAITDHKGDMKISPGPDDRLMKGDTVTVVGSDQSIYDLEKCFGVLVKPRELP